MSVAKDNQEFFPVSRTTLANLGRDFTELLKNYSADEEKIGEIVSQVVSKYCEKHRFYHNLSHVGALLFLAENFRQSITDEKSVQLAIWFHDAIYEPKRLTNEVESAALAAKSLSELRFPGKIIEKVEKMILATQKHDQRNLDADGKLFLDLDLSILGAEPEIYKKYARAIRKEYSFVPESLYRYKRRIILESFLQSKFIYCTEKLREMFEARARRNIANEIKELS